MKIMIATFILVFMRAIQQQNVIGKHYAMAAITSYCIAAAEVLVIYWIASKGIDAFLWVGTGGALGVTLAIFLHTKLVKLINGHKNI